MNDGYIHDGFNSHPVYRVQSTLSDKPKIYKERSEAIVPRKPVVSRTFNVQVVTCTIGDTSKNLMTDKKYNLVRKCKDEKAYLKACKAIEDNPDIEVLRVKDIQEKQVLARQEELYFFENSEKIYLN